MSGLRAGFCGKGSDRLVECANGMNCKASTLEWYWKYCCRATKDKDLIVGLSHAAHTRTGLPPSGKYVERSGGAASHVKPCTRGSATSLGIPVCITGSSLRNPRGDPCEYAMIGSKKPVVERLLITPPSRGSSHEGLALKEHGHHGVEPCSPEPLEPSPRTSVPHLPHAGDRSPPPCHRYSLQS